MKRFLTFILVGVLMFGTVGCSGSTAVSDTPSQTSSAQERVDSEAEVSAELEDISQAPEDDQGYQAILDEYSQQIRDAVPALVEEYNAEAANNTDGLEGLAALCNDKVGKLAEISNEGISEMAEYHLHAGSGSYEEYEEWAGKLMDVYMEEAAKIQEAYLESAM